MSKIILFFYQLNNKYMLPITKPIKRAKLDLLRASKIVHTEMLTGTGNQIKIQAKNRFLHIPGIDKYTLTFI